MTPWTVAQLAPLSRGFPKQEYWSGLSFSSRGSSQVKDRTCISCIGRKVLYHWATREAPPVRMAIIKKTTNNKSWRGCGEKGTLVHCWWGCKFVQSLWKTIWMFFKKAKNRVTIIPTSSTPGIYPKKMKALIQKDTCTPLFTEALLIHSVTMLYTCNISIVHQLYFNEKEEISSKDAIITHN